MKIAAITFSMSPCASAHEFWARVEGALQKSRAQGATVVVFPEYMWLALCFAGGIDDFFAQVRSFAESRGAFLPPMQELARRYGMLIVAGSAPYLDEGRIVNRAWMMSPEGGLGYQDKLHMTRFESEEWQIEGGTPAIQIIRWQALTLAVAICYDVEFPAYTAVLAQERVDLVCVPSNTDNEHGYWRVRHCSQARAVENQCFVAMASVVGVDARSPLMGEHAGQSAVFAPCDHGFPPNGVLAESEKNVASLAVAELSRDVLLLVRERGTVLNLRDQTSSERPIRVHRHDW